MKLSIPNILCDSIIYANYFGRATILVDDICRAKEPHRQWKDLLIETYVIFMISINKCILSS